MKKLKLFSVIIILALSGLGLSACSGQTFLASSWPGLTADPENNRVYVSFAKQVIALDANTGVLQWAFPTEDEIQARTGFYAPPTLTADGKQLIVGGYDNVLYSLDPNTGTKNWAFSEAKGYYIGSALATPNGIFAPNADDSLYGLDLAGKKLWDPFVATHGFWSKPQSDGSNIYAASVDHHIYAINPATGKVAWDVNLNSAIIGDPTLDSGKIFAGSFGKTVSVIDLATQQIRCTFSVEDWLWASPVLAGNTLYVGDSKGKVYAFDQATCIKSWDLPFIADGPIYSKPIVVNDTIFFGTETGTIYALAKTGVQRWSKSLGSKIYSSPVTVNDLIIFAAVDAKNTLQVIAMDAEGLVQWSYTPTESK